MRLETEFYRLPLRFDPERLATEVLQFSEAEWRPHPQGHVGNTAIPLISVNGGMNDDMRGPMRPTPFLERCPYLQQVLESLGTVVGRARLMRIAGESDANPHVDASYYWRHHVRVHVPAVTYPEVQFLCGDNAVNMAAGEAWIFDSWKLHNVINPKTTPRIHLVADTVGNRHFWDHLVAGAHRPFAPENDKEEKPRFVPYVPGKVASIPLETTNFPVVMTPWEQESLASRIFSDLEPACLEAAQPLLERTQALHREWLGLWAQFGDSEQGWVRFQSVMLEYKEQLTLWQDQFRLINGMGLTDALRHSIVSAALTPELASVGALPARTEGTSIPSAGSNGSSRSEATKSGLETALEQPVFIIAAPRSGSTMLFELLSRSPGFVTTGGESHGIIERIDNLNPANRDFDSNRLTESDADPDTAEMLRTHFLERLRANGDDATSTGRAVRMLEKTPKNALRIPFLRAVFPKARFIYLYREPEENISSILEAWRAGKFVTYRGLPGWNGLPWSLALIPGWRDLIGKDLAEVAARQWTEINTRVLSDLEAIPPEDWCAISYAEIVSDPQAAAVRLCQFSGVPWTEEAIGPLPPSRYTLTPPAPDKWRKNEAEMKPHLGLTEPVVERVRAVLNGSGLTGSEARDQADSEPVELTSVHTSNFPALLSDLGISLLVTTYQAGRLIVVREQAGSLNTHFRSFRSPMGLAYDGVRLAIGTKQEIWHFVNQTDVAPKLLPVNTHDAAFLPRSCHHTGDIRVHELAYAGTELWAVNTRFSCLCSFDSEHSFVPRWRPPFVSALAPEDRCHLNGMALVDDAVKYVTCLGLTNEAGGWRENKASGGCILEVPSGEVVASGLSMPHSPRVYGGHLWVLESGQGALLKVDPKTGETREVVRMPGFTRGMDFFGPYAFIGLSQVRETAIFSGLPLTERLPESERSCGVWVVDLRNGKTVAFLRFETGVQEIFAIQVLSGIRHPDVITDDDQILGSSFVLPESSLVDVPATLLGANPADGEEPLEQAVEMAAL